MMSDLKEENRNGGIGGIGEGLGWFGRKSAKGVLCLIATV